MTQRQVSDVHEMQPQGREHGLEVMKVPEHSSVEGHEMRQSVTTQGHGNERPGEEWPEVKVTTLGPKIGPQ